LLKGFRFRKLRNYVNAAKVEQSLVMEAFVKLFVLNMRLIFWKALLLSIWQKLV